MADSTREAALAKAEERMSEKEPSKPSVAEIEEMMKEGKAFSIRPDGTLGPAFPTVHRLEDILNAETTNRPIDGKLHKAMLVKVDNLQKTDCPHRPPRIGGRFQCDCRECLADALQHERDEGFSAGWKQGAHDKELEWKTRRRRGEADSE